MTQKEINEFIKWHKSLTEEEMRKELNDIVDKIIKSSKGE